MIKLYFKQAFHLLGENKLLSSISIIGTALAIAMIMVIVITLRATIAPFLHPRRFSCLGGPTRHLHSIYRLCAFHSLNRQYI